MLLLRSGYGNGVIVQRDAWWDLVGTFHLLVIPAPRRHGVVLTGRTVCGQYEPPLYVSIREQVHILPPGAKVCSVCACRAAA